MVELAPLWYGVLGVVVPRQMVVHAFTTLRGGYQEIPDMALPDRGLE